MCFSMGESRHPKGRPSGKKPLAISSYSARRSATPEREEAALDAVYRYVLARRSESRRLDADDAREDGL